MWPSLSLLRSMRNYFGRARIRVAAALLLLLSSIGCADPTGSDLPPLELPLRDRIVFSSNRVDSLFDIYTVRTDGSDPRRLTGDGRADTCPAISPDGNWIAYYVKDPTSAVYWYSLVLMRADGSGRKVLANAEPPFSPSFCPSWSDNGKFILYPKIRPDAEGMLEVFNTSGDSVWAFKRYNIGNPALSPDGSRIAIGTWQTTSGPDIDFRIRIVGPSGIGPIIASGKFPSWSPGGDEIIYSCTEGQLEQISGLCVGAPDGTGQRKINPTPGFGARYSPDGSRLAFNCVGPDNTLGICFATSAGAPLGNTFGIVLNSSRASRFAWSREGDYIAFECESPTARICVIKPDGSGFRTVTNTSSFDTFPSLSPSSGR